MFEYHALRVALGISELLLVWILWKNDIGYLWRFGLLMFAMSAANLAPAYPSDEAWQWAIQIPAYAAIFVLMAAVTVEFFAFLRRRTFIEERAALLSWSGVMGLIPVWIFWWWPGETLYQNIMLARQYALIWLAGTYLAAWIWLRAIRPIHAELQLADHGEFWGFWLISAAALSSTTKWGILWRFTQWEGGEQVWRAASDTVMLVQIVICAAFAFNLLKWKNLVSGVAPDESLYPQDPARFQQRRLLHL